MPYDIFISYSSENKAFADAACSKLENLGIRCLIAPRDVRPGDDFRVAILEAINNCRVVVLVFSHFANQSKHVIREVNRAVDRGKVIVPIRIDDATPTGALEYSLSDTHWLDAITPPVDRHLQKLADTICQFLVAAGVQLSRRGSFNSDASPSVKTPTLIEQRINSLIQKLSESDLSQEEKNSILIALKITFIPKAITAWCQHLSHPDARGIAILALEKIGHPAVPALVEHLAGPSAAGATVALNKIGAVSAIPALIQALKGPGGANALIVLEKIGADAVPALVEALEGAGGAYASLALGKIGTPAVSLLIDAVNHPLRKVRVNAALALKNVGREAAIAIPALKKLSTRSDAECELANEVIALING